MTGDIVCRKSDTTARDILTEAIARAGMIGRHMNLFEAISAAEELWRRFGLYVKPEYLCDVLTALEKGDSDAETNQVP